MTAQGKRKENNEIKPLPSWFELDVTTCLFSTAPVFSQLWKFLCSFGNMIHLFRERGKKKKGGRWGRKSSSFPSAASSTASFRLSVCLLGPKRLRSKGTCFWGGEERENDCSSLSPGARWMTDRQLQARHFPKTGMETYDSISAHTHTKKGNQPFTFLFLNVCSTKTSTRFQYLALRKI